MQHQPVAKMYQRMVDDIAKYRRQRHIAGDNGGIRRQPGKARLREMRVIDIRALLPPLPVARPVDQRQPMGLGKPVAHQRVTVRHPVPVTARHQRVGDPAAKPEQPGMRLAPWHDDPPGKIIRLRLPQIGT